MITKEYIFSGIVQGMGFRPTALRLATELGSFLIFLLM